MKTNENTQINTDAFMALSAIGLSSVERLTTLNLNATRAVIENSLAVSATALKAKSDAEQKNLLTSTPTAITNSALAYLQEAQEIAADTQKEVTKLITSYLSQQGDGTPSAAWTKGFEMFKSLGQQITNMAEANARTAVEATDRATRSVTAAAKKAA